MEIVVQVTKNVLGDLLSSSDETPKKSLDVRVQQPDFSVDVNLIQNRPCKIRGPVADWKKQSKNAPQNQNLQGWQGPPGQEPIVAE